MSPPPFHIGHIDHVVLRVRDLQRALDFYCGALGCAEERRVENFGLVQLRAGGSLIDLIVDTSKADHAETRNMDHFALTVTPFDEARLGAHLLAHGIAAGRVETRYGAEGAGPSLYIHDPDGNQVELKGPPA